MEVLERHSGDNEYGPLFECTDGSLNFIDLFFGCGGVHNDISIISSIIWKKLVSISKVCTIIPLLDNIFITRFEDLLNCLAVQVGMCSTITNFILRNMVTNNGAPFTNIKSAQELQTCVILENT